MTCAACGQALDPYARACPQCHALVHAGELDALSAEAREAESRHDFAAARGAWTRALSLLPWDTTQAAWIRRRLREFPDDAPRAAVAAPPRPSDAPSWTRKLGPLAPIAAALLKGKGLLALFNLKFLLSLGAFVGFYWTIFGFAFGVGFAALILIHELGHYVDIKRRGLPADMPIFLPGLGAYVRWRAMGVSADVRAMVSLAGPIAGALAAVVCAICWRATGADLWAALAHASAWLNLLNLTPIWVLDGAGAANVLSRQSRLWLVTLSLGLALVFSQGMFFVVAIGAAFRLVTHDAPETSNRTVALTMSALLVGLGLVMWMLPATPGVGLPT